VEQADTTETADTVEQADTTETADAVEQADTEKPADADDHVESTPEEISEDITTPTASILPEGFIAIDQNGRTPDGSVPYIFLKNQLDRMR
jgi:hypothetical protein